MKIIISGGGTGGHIYPAVSIIEELKKRDEENEILYVGTEHGLENKIINDLGIPFKSIRVRGLPRKINKKSFIAIHELFKGLQESKNIISSFKPDVVIGTGGFVSGPILFSATRKNILTVFHEQNSYPGITNRILSNYVDFYFVTFKESLRHLKRPGHGIVTGNPIRNRFENLGRREYSQFELDSSKKTVFSFGGSNGSVSINKAILETLPQFAKTPNIQLIHVTGSKNYDKFLDSAGELPENVKIYPYLNNIEQAYNITDLIITSSGAITLAEISFLGIPSILIPKAYTTENHQEYNARVYENIGAAKIILEKDLNGNSLYEDIMKIVSEDKKLEDMGKAAKSLAKPHATEEIVHYIYKNLR